MSYMGECTLRASVPRASAGANQGLGPAMEHRCVIAIAARLRRHHPSTDFCASRRTRRLYSLGSVRSICRGRGGGQ